MAGRRTRPLPAVAGTQDLGDDGTTVAVLVGDSVGLVGVEGGTGGVDAFQPLLAEGLDQHLIASG